jgi:hypothetical protein
MPDLSFCRITRVAMATKRDEVESDLLGFGTVLKQDG